MDEAQPPELPPVGRVVDSYNGVPCTCGVIHTRCRGHKDGRPCLATPRPGLLVCRRHGGSSPEAEAVVRRAKQQRLVGRLVGDGEPVLDPEAELQRIAGESRAMVDGLRELVMLLQDDGGDHLSVGAGARWVKRDRDGDVEDEGNHPEVTGDGLIVQSPHLEVTGDGLIVQSPSGNYDLHPLYKALERAMDRHAKLLADMAKIGLVERQVVLEEQKIATTVRALRMVFQRVGIDPDQALGQFAAALREVEALPAPLGEVIATTAQLLDEDDEP